MTNPIIGPNDETILAWNTVLYDKWIRFRPIFSDGLAAHGDALLERCGPVEGCRVLDVGCGFGDTTQRLGMLVGERGSAVGVDAAERFIEAASLEAARAGSRRTSFFVADVQKQELGGPWDLAYSRFGTMFFANPVAALRNVRRALDPRGRLAMVVWRKREDNEWLHAAELTVRELLEEPEDSDLPTCGPGPFSLASADMLTDVLGHAGFHEIVLERFDAEICIGRDLDEAVAFAMNLGPAGEIVRLCGDEGERMRPRIDAALRERFTDQPRDRLGRILAASSTWLVTARPR
jgi:SAM-dependent methyltransferase